MRKPSIPKVKKRTYAGKYTWSGEPKLRRLEDPAEIRQATLRYIEEHRGMYLATKNPIYVWFAFMAHRRAKLPLPDWILEYFDACYWGLWPAAFTIRAGGKAESAIAKAFGINARHFDQQADFRDRVLAKAMESETHIEGKLYRRRAEIAKAHGVSESTVRRAVRKIGRVTVKKSAS